MACRSIARTLVQAFDPRSTQPVRVHVLAQRRSLRTATAHPGWMQKTWRDYLAEQEQAIARWQALAGGLSADQWDWRVKHAWQSVVPGVAVGHTGGLTDRQRAWCAVLHAGRGAALSADAALLHHGLWTSGSGGLWKPADLDVAVPSTRKVTRAVLADGGAVVCQKVAGLAAWRGVNKGYRSVDITAAQRARRRA